MMLIVLGGLMVLAGVALVSAGRRFADEPEPVRRTPSPARPEPARRAVPEREVAMREPTSGKPGEFAQARIGQTITYKHPERGGLTGKILGTVKYVELWQRRKAPNEPWVPTGNVFTAHWLGDTLLYEWKGGIWLLDSYDQLTDAEIKSTFLPPAQRFGQSDETEAVSFAYPPASWTITDIGKFRVDRAEGQGLRLSAGATGRFIHSRGNTGNEGRTLVVEDYQDGVGGQDTAWRGWKITWEDMLSIQ
jgi:hypothetical protein